jgi:DNA gyrase/topoisomerase IV subunit A
VPGLWWEEIRPQQEWERRDVLRRREATEGLLAAFDQLDAIHRMIADAPDWPSAHAALTAEPFGYTDLQAFHILTFPAGRRTAEGRSDLESQHAGLRTWLARLDAFFADRPDREQTSLEPPAE